MQIRKRTGGSGWLDQFLAPYSSRRFEKVVARFGRGKIALAAAVGLVMLCLGSAALFMIMQSGVQRAYLVTAGVEAWATVVETAFEPNRRGEPEWTRVKYIFETRNGEKVSDAMRRFTWEVKELSPGNQMQVLYIERWPRVNLPLIGFQNSGFLLMMGLLCLAADLHLVLFLLRYWRWRKAVALGIAANQLQS